MASTPRSRARPEESEAFDLEEFENIEWEEEEDDDDDNEGEGVDFDAAFNHALEAVQQQGSIDGNLPESSNVVAESNAALEDILVKTRAKNARKAAADRERNERRRIVKQKLEELKTMILDRLTLAVNLNSTCDEMRDRIASVMPDEIITKLSEGTLSSVQQFIGFVRQTFQHRSASAISGFEVVDSLDQTVLNTKEGSELAIAQIIVGMLRAIGIPARLVIRLTQDLRNCLDEHDVWVEVFLPTTSSQLLPKNTKVWHRIYGSIWRVIEAEGEEMKYEKGKTVDPSRKRTNHSAIEPFPRRIDDRKSTICVLGYGDANHIANVSSRYMTRPFRESHPIIRFITSIIEEWCTSANGAVGPYSKEACIEERHLLEREMGPIETIIPTSLEGFKKSSEFILGDVLIKSNRFILRKDAKPVNLFRGQPVYRKSDLEALKTEWGWKKVGRRILDAERDLPKSMLPERTLTASDNSDAQLDKQDSSPLHGKGNNRKKRKQVDPVQERIEEGADMEIETNMIVDMRRALFGESQTEIIDSGEVDNSTLEVPTNEYGNIEIFCAEMVPRGGVHLLEPFCDKACQDLHIPFAPAVVGFDYRDKRMRPKFGGIVVAKSVKGSILERAKAIAEQVRIDEEKRSKLQRAQLWLDLLETNWLVMQTAANATSLVENTESSSADGLIEGKSSAAVSCASHSFEHGKCERCGVLEADVEYF